MHVRLTRMCVFLHRGKGVSGIRKETGQFVQLAQETPASYTIFASDTAPFHFMLDKTFRALHHYQTRTMFPLQMHQPHFSTSSLIDSYPRHTYIHHLSQFYCYVRTTWSFQCHCQSIPTLHPAHSPTPPPSPQPHHFTRVQDSQAPFYPFQEIRLPSLP